MPAERMPPLAEQLPVGIALLRPDGGLIDLNAHGCRMLGYTREESRQLNCLTLVHPDERAGSRAHLAALAAGESDACTLDRRLLCKDGRYLWVSMALTPLVDASGTIGKLACTLQDIDARKLVEERLRRILREMPIATAVVNWNGTLAHRSEKFEALFGYSHEEVPSMQAWLPLAYPDPAYRQVIATQIAEVVASAQREGRVAGPLLARVRCRDGSDKMIEFHYVDLVQQGVWTMADVSGRHLLEAAMRAANEHLMARLGEIHQLQEQLREQAIRDPLTGLYNRRYLDETLTRELARAQREGGPLSLILIDIDRFKQINDTHGHPAGDEVLRTLAGLLREGARLEDIPCRYGGEEFLLVLPGMDLPAARQRAEDWRERFAGQPVIGEGFALDATLSAGIAVFPAHGQDSAALIEAADRALYAAKRLGRNRCETATPPSPTDPATPAS